MIKTILFALAVVGLSGCWGYTSIDNELTGQVKKVHHNTPLICPDYYSADVSLGVMRNGVGSMSTQDVAVTIPDKELLHVFEEAASTGKLVKVVFKVRRFTICIEDHVIDSVEILKD